MFDLEGGVKEFLLKLFLSEKDPSQGENHETHAEVSSSIVLVNLFTPRAGIIP
jgi:hypothetical protein